MRSCTNPNCTQRNPQEDCYFEPRPGVRSGFQSRCKACDSQRKREYRKEHKEETAKRAKIYCEATREKKRDYDRFKCTGVTGEQYRSKLEEQGYSCAICGRSQEEFTKALHADHDHETGIFRGVLCGPCNKALGLLREDPELIKKAAAYIERAK